MDKVYSLRKCKHILRHTFKHYRRRGQKFSVEIRISIFDAMVALQDAIIAKDRPDASQKAHAVEALYDAHFERPAPLRWAHSVLGLLFVLGVAIIIRQLWFELYEIPTGSMRPTLQEKDRLVVSKSPFGINIPLIPDHMYFNPDLVKRGNIVVFTTAGMDIPDSNMLYFYLFPGKKQYVKRLIGKPGDTLYFYGGQIYGIDARGNSIDHELQNPQLGYINHVPFIQFDGKIQLPSQPKNGIYTPVIIKQTNQPVARLNAYASGHVQGQMLPNPNKPQGINASIPNYFDLWGFKNYAMCRLITPQKAAQFYPRAAAELEGLYLELTHHPSIKNAHLMQNYKGHFMPALDLSQTYLPLETPQLKKLYKSLTTARFIVKDELARRYGAPAITHPTYPSMHNIPNGTYQFQQGVAYKVLPGGILSQLPPSHPLNQYDEKRLLTLYNLGIEFNTYYSPTSKNQVLPSRYAYFRNGDFYTMNMPILKADDPTLIRFIHDEYLRQQNAPTYAPYYPFDDQGPPSSKDDFLMRYGLTVPEGHYFVLGDNYAMSADSRDFGFVPAGNLRGQTSFIFWPPGPRFGFPIQASAPLFSFPNLLVWVLAFIGILFSWRHHYRTHHLPLDFGDRPE
ncbi:MAG: signal peptidase I [Chlamydiales bacterium]|nr:signal peptidase I [Chlamydiales bacterium]